MQLKRVIESGLTYTSFADGPGAKLRLFFLYLYVCLRPVPRARHRPPFRLRLCWNGKQFDYYVREKMDFFALAHVFLDDEYDLAAVADPPGIIFDVGSNVGVTVIFFKLRFPAARVFAFEPDPHNLELLRKNVSQFEGVTVIARAVSDRADSELELYTSKKGHMSSSMYQRRPDDEVKVVSTITLDRAMEQFGVDHVDLLKFDIEGAEYHLFKGLSRPEAVSYLVGEIHKDLLPVSVEDLMGLLTQNFQLLSDQDPALSGTQSKPVVLMKNRKL